MTLEQIVCLARIRIEVAPNSVIPSDVDIRIANAVRAFLGSEEVVAAGRDAILENLRDRRLLKWLFAEDPENHGAIGYVDGPIDAETQKECAESLARSALSSIGGE